MNTLCTANIYWQILEGVCDNEHHLPQLAVSAKSIPEICSNVASVIMLECKGGGGGGGGWSRN